MTTEELKFRLPPSVVLRAKQEKTLLNPCDVQYQGDVMQRLGGTPPPELVEAYRHEEIHVYAEGGFWWAEPLRNDDV